MSYLKASDREVMNKIHQILIMVIFHLTNIIKHH